MNRCSFCEWIPILPLPVWPLAGQFLLGQNVVVGSMPLLLAVRGNIATRSMSGPPCALQLHRTTVWCGATILPSDADNQRFQLLVDGRTAWRLPLLRTIKLFGDQFAMPGEDGVRFNDRRHFRQRLP